MAKQRTARRRGAKGKEAEVALRAPQALELRRRGYSYQAIGSALGVSIKTAWYDVQDELGRLHALAKDEAEKVRELELSRLDDITLKLQPALDTGDPRAAQTLIRVMERRARYLGLDAPTTIAGPDGAAAVTINVLHQQIE